MSEYLNEQQRRLLSDLVGLGWELHSVTPGKLGGYFASVRARDGSDQALIREDGLLCDG